MNELVGIYGASGFGREVMPVIRQLYNSNEGTRFVFIDDGSTQVAINGHPVVSWTAFLELPASIRRVTVAIADSTVRKRLLTRCTEAGIASRNVIATNVVIGDSVVLDAGAILQPFVTLTSNIRIGIGFQANIYSYVGHDCVIGDYVTFAPRVMCNGNVHIGDRAYIGTGAIIRQGTPEKPLVIGADAVVGMGAVVTKDVPAGATVIGNPARIMAKG